jgi:hypothetical protein
VSRQVLSKAPVQVSQAAFSFSLPSCPRALWDAEGKAEAAVAGAMEGATAGARNDQSLEAARKTILAVPVRELAEHEVSCWLL